MDPIFLSIVCWFCIFPVLFLLFFGVVAGIIYIAQRKNNDAWRALAQRAGLTFNKPGWFLGRPTLTGNWHERVVRVYTKTSGAPDMGSGPSAYMLVDMAINLTVGTRFTLLERDLFHQPGKEDIRNNDPEFDQRFIARGHPPEFIRQMLMDVGLRRSMLQARYLNLETTGGQLRYRLFNIETDVEYMLFLLSLLFDLAEALEYAQAG